MRRYLLRRILLIIPTLLLVSFFVFSIVRLLPGDVVTIMMADHGFAKDKEEMREILGLNKPLVIQYVFYLKNVLKGDLGISLWSGEPVREEIFRRLPITIRLGLMALFWTFLLGVPIGIISALYQDRWLDYVIRSLAIAGLSIPGFWIAILVLIFGSIWFKWVPPMDYIPFLESPVKSLSQLLAPSLILAVHLSASIMRMTRTMMLEVLKEDYIRTARAKGLSRWVVITRHALKNALIPVLSIMGIQIAYLIGGTVIMESIFVLPGMGKYLLDAIIWRDYPAIQGINLFICIWIITINLLVDSLYGLLDPRIRYRK
ncbi:MAG: ABC transporter permease [Deltaproteobacteria bacterium]|nr:ABC transporter permease [Deltaproteobacteria bacterium]